MLKQIRWALAASAVAPLLWTVALADPVVIAGDHMTNTWDFGHAIIRVGSPGSWEIGTGSPVNDWTTNADVADVGTLSSGFSYGFTLSFDATSGSLSLTVAGETVTYATGMRTSPSALLISFEGVDDDTQGVHQDVFLTDLQVNGSALSPSGLAGVNFGAIPGSSQYWTLTNLTDFGTLSGNFQFDYTLGAGFKPNIQFVLGDAPASVPEPMSLLLLGLGVAGVGLAPYRRRG